MIILSQITDGSCFLDSRLVRMLRNQKEEYIQEVMLKKRKCKECGKKFEPLNNNQYLCSFECLKGYNSEKKVKERVRGIKKELKDISYYRELLQVIFNTFVRLRDREEPCISCGAYTNGGHASHFFSVGGFPSVRFNEDNVHKSCVKCNTHLHGNLAEYELRLIKKIGKRRFTKLTDEATRSNKLTIEELKELIKKYRGRINEIKNN